MIEVEPCNLQPCPIDCVVDEWSEYGLCTKDCGGGIQTRVRKALTDAEHGGEPCGDLSETIECNVFACDMRARSTLTGLSGPRARRSVT